jgi:Predicted metal-binding protein
MLRAAEPGAAVVVCSTCRVSPETREDEGGRRGGALLAEAMRAVQQEVPELAGVAVQEMPCLFACKRHCTVHVRAPGKVGYVLGDFTPERDAARAILEYAAHHAASEEGVVRYADWPEGVKGHFITRTPPEGYLCT